MVNSEVLAGSSNRHRIEDPTLERLLQDKRLEIHSFKDISEGSANRFSQLVTEALELEEALEKFGPTTRWSEYEQHNNSEQKP